MLDPIVEELIKKRLFNATTEAKQKSTNQNVENVLKIFLQILKPTPAKNLSKEKKLEEKTKAAYERKHKKLLRQVLKDLELAWEKIEKAEVKRELDKIDKEIEEIRKSFHVEPVFFKFYNEKNKIKSLQELTQAPLNSKNIDEFAKNIVESDEVHKVKNSVMKPKPPTS